MPSYRLRVVCSALLLSGCVSTGFTTPSYVDLPEQIPPARDAAAARVHELLAGPSPGLPQLLEAAELGNPRIAAARHAVGASAGRAWQAELYPNPILEFETEQVPAGEPGLERSVNTVGLTQPLVIGGRRAAGVAAARAAKDATLLQLQQARREVAASLREVRADLLYLQRAETLIGTLVSAAEQTFEIAETRLEARAVPESELLKAEVELRLLQLEQRRLQRERRATLARLAALVGREEVGELTLDGALSNKLPDLDLAALLSRLTEHPGLLAAYANASTAGKEAELARAERIPDVGIRVEFGRNNIRDLQIFNGGISIPLPLFNRNQGRIHEAEQRQRERSRSAEDLERRLHGELAQLSADYATARDAAQTHGDRIVPAAERAFSQISESYRAGRAAFLDLLDAQRTLAQAQLTQLRALRDAHVTLARLSQITGPLEAE